MRGNQELISAIKEFSEIILNYSESGLVEKRDSLRLHRISKDFKCKDAWHFVIVYEETFKLFGIRYNGFLYYKDRQIFLTD